jgi:hypothetical protein
MEDLICSGLSLLGVLVFIGIAMWLRTPAGQRYFRKLKRDYREEQRRK